jgi:hypothetical protein
MGLYRGRLLLCLSLLEYYDDVAGLGLELGHDALQAIVLLARQTNTTK